MSPGSQQEAGIREKLRSEGPAPHQELQTGLTGYPRLDTTKSGISLWFLILISLMTNDVKCFKVCFFFFAIHVSFWWIICSDYLLNLKIFLFFNSLFFFFFFKSWKYGNTCTGDLVFALFHWGFCFLIFEFWDFKILKEIQFISFFILGIMLLVF